MEKHLAPILLYFTTFLLCVCLAAMPSCSASVDCKKPENAASAKCTVINGSVDCAGSDFDGAVAKYGPVITDIVHSGLNPDGSINYDAIGSKLEDAFLKYGGCVVSDVFSKYVFAKQVAMLPDGSATGVTAPTPAEARATFAKLRAKMAPGIEFKTSSGVL